MFRRTVACGGNAGTVAFFCTWFTGSLSIEGVHPLESGFLRKKNRRDRRLGLPRESVLVFYPQFWLETASKIVRLAAIYIRIRMRYLPIKRDPNRRNYIDLAITPVTDEEEEPRAIPVRGRPGLSGPGASARQIPSCAAGERAINLRLRRRPKKISPPS